MAEQDFHSLSKGVFVIPFRPQDHAQAGPSRLTPPLKRYYDEAFGRYQKAYDEYEQNRVTGQIQDVTDWLKRCASPPWISVAGGTYRVPLAIIQNAGSALETRLDASLVARHVVTLKGRDVLDVASGTRAIALGLVSASIANSRSGMAGLDLVEEWYADRRESDRGPILIQITSAQLVPLETMSELLYVLALHPSLPIHVLLSVPSTAIFLDTLSFVEPASVDMTILDAGKARGSGAVGAILRADDDVTTGLRLSEELREKLYRDEDMFGAGPQAALKAIKFGLLHHSHTSPLAALANTDHTRAEAVIQGHVPGTEDLTVVDISDDMLTTLDPIPRTTVLHALQHPSDFIDPVAERAAALASQPASIFTTPSRKRGKQVIDVVDLSDTTPKSAKRRRLDASASATSIPIVSPAPPTLPTPIPMTALPDPSGIMAERGDLKELQVMFNLYKAAGRNVNLWDWLEGFRKSMLPGGMGKDKRMDKDKEAETETRDEEADTETLQAGIAASEAAEENSARLHAAFVRFCEEARMMGLMRARGNARRSGVDEVVKSIGLI